MEAEGERFAMSEEGLREKISEAVRIALEEDVRDGDITTLWTVREKKQATAEIVSRAHGVAAGVDVAREVFRQVDSLLSFKPLLSDGDTLAPDEVVVELSGSARGMLTAERVALNFLQRMSGIASLTRKYVDACDGTGVKILDTRKTVPGLRVLDKYAVSKGGGGNHRMGLFDMVLLEENHIEAADGIGPAIAAARSGMQRAGRQVMVEVEVEDLAGLEDALAAGADWIMLDNMDVESMAKAVIRVGRDGKKRPILEASGNISLENVRAVAQSGVDVISVGALTHSVSALDLSMLIH